MKEKMAMSNAITAYKKGVRSELQIHHWSRLEIGFTDMRLITNMFNDIFWKLCAKAQDVRSYGLCGWINYNRIHFWVSF